MKILLSTRGSMGDVRPVVLLAKWLENIGHQVHICVPKVFEDLVKSKDLGYTLYDEDIQEFMRSINVGMKASKRVLDWFKGTMDEQLKILLPLLKDASAFIGTASEPIAPTVAQLAGVPFYRVVYVPVFRGGDYAPPMQPKQELPKWLNTMFWKVLDSSVNLMLKKDLNRIRKRHGLAPVKDVPAYLTYGTTLMAFSDVLAPPCNEWKSKYKYHYIGPIFEPESGTLSKEVEAFLNAGEPPVYFGFGSVDVQDPEHVTRMVIDAARRAGCRVLLSKGWANLGRNIQTDDKVLIIGNEPHESLFSRVAGVCHHGGSGTTHAAARAGVAQFIMPQIVDQFFWGHQAWKLGLGPKPLHPNKLNVEILTRAFETLSDTSNEYHLKAREVADRMNLRIWTEAVQEIFGHNSARAQNTGKI